MGGGQSQPRAIPVTEVPLGRCYPIQNQPPNVPNFTPQDSLWDGVDMQVKTQATLNPAASIGMTMRSTTNPMMVGTMAQYPYQTQMPMHQIQQTQMQPPPPQPPSMPGQPMPNPVMIGGQQMVNLPGQSNMPQNLGRTGMNYGFGGRGSGGPMAPFAPSTPIAPSPFQTSVQSEVTPAFGLSGTSNPSPKQKKMMSNSTPANLVDEQGRKWFLSEQILGAGGFGKVYMGMDERGKPVALKELDEEGSNESTSAALKEVDMLRKIDHPNIVRYLSFLTANGHLYIVMEYVAGGSVYALIKKFGKLSVDITTRYARDILEGLDYLHSNDVIHRDIKPQNLLVDHDGRCKLTDFGTAGYVTTLTRSNVVGTPLYISPEALNGEPGKPSDIWSLGLTVLQMQTGKPPYSGNFREPIAVMFHIANNDPEIPTNLPPLVQDFIKLCIQRDTKLRPTAKHLLQHYWLRSGGTST